MAKMKKRILLTAVVCLLIASHAVANSTPGYIANGLMDWNRGAANTTWQEWDFLAGNNAASPEGSHNSYGNPSIVLREVPVKNSDIAFGWHENYFGRTGVWSGDAVYADVLIPNTDNTGGSKTVWMEIGFAAAKIDQFPIVVPYIAGDQAGNFGVEQLSLSVTRDGDSNWWILQASWLIVPNPQSEKITFGFAGTGGYIDYITVDTQCVPVPGAIIISGMGIAFVGWFGRRRLL